MSDRVVLLNQTALDTKTNPLYQSNENLAIDEPVAMEDASGYLDVAPEEIGKEKERAGEGSSFSFCSFSTFAF